MDPRTERTLSGGAFLLESSIKLFHADNRVRIVAAASPPQLLLDGTRSLKDYITPEKTNVTNALALALCVGNKETLDPLNVLTATRIIVLTASSVETYDFVNCMNCAFAAQKLSFVVDVIDCSQSNSPSLRQLSHHTNGWYLNLSPSESKRGSLSHALLYYFSSPYQARSKVSPPPPVANDMRTICICHNRLISTGYVCSVCLSVFCDETGKPKFCSACDSRVYIPLRLPRNQ